jgi:hypothetical protein
MPALDGLTVHASRHRSSVFGANFLSEGLGLSAGQPGESPTEKGEDQIIATNRELLDCCRDRRVAL